MRDTPKRGPGEGETDPQMSALKPLISDAK